MIHKVFSIYDSKAGAFLPPFILPRTEMAKRTFGDCVNSDQHQFGAHPEDYTLFDLGTFDDEKGQYMLNRTPQSLGIGIEYLRLESEESHGTLEEKPTAVGNGSSVLTSTASSDTAE